jgi:hypothetical protein
LLVLAIYRRTGRASGRLLASLKSDGRVNLFSISAKSLIKNKVKSLEKYSAGVLPQSALT